MYGGGDHKNIIDSIEKLHGIAFGGIGLTKKISWIKFK